MPKTVADHGLTCLNESFAFGVGEQHTSRLLPSRFVPGVARDREDGDVVYDTNM